MNMIKFDELNFEKVEKVIEAHNASIDEKKLKYERNHKNPKTGEVDYTITYRAEEWQLQCTRGRAGRFYQLYKKLVNKNGQYIEVIVPLLNDHVTKLNWYKNNELSRMQVGSSMKLVIKTRFYYGKASDGNYYIRYNLWIGDMLTIADFINRVNRELMFVAFADKDTCFDIYFDKIQSLENMDIPEEVEIW